MGVSAGSGAGRKVLSLVASMLVGGLLHRRRAAAAVGLSGGGAALWGGGAVDCGVVFEVVHVRACAPTRQRRPSWGLSPGVVWGRRAETLAEMTVDLDSTVCEVCGKAKHGASYGHTKVLGYHPLVAVRSDTGEVLHSRMRSGSSQRGNERFARETLARVRRLAADATVTVRADAGFFSYDMIAAIGAHGASYSITIPHNAQVKAAIAAIDDDAWASIEYTRGGEAQVAESTIEARPPRRQAARPRRRSPPKLRLVIRRSRLLGAQGELWPNWRYHWLRHRPPRPRHLSPPTRTTAATPQSSSPSETSKKSSGLSRCPSGRFPANGAWLACCVLAHNLARWTARLGRAHPATPTHRRSHHPQPAPHRARPPRQPQQADTDWVDSTGRSNTGLLE